MNPRNPYGSETGRTLPTAEDRAHDLAIRLAEKEVGSIENYKGDEQKYWDQYWDAYYDYFDGAFKRFMQQEEEIDTLTALKELIQTLQGEQPALSNESYQTEFTESKENQEYIFFRDEIARQDLFLYCSKLADYLHDKQIADLVIADRSARPVYVGVLEYWREKYPEQRIPNILFMNPKGFIVKESLTDRDYDQIAAEAIYVGDRPEPAASARTEKVILEEIKTKYSSLMLDKDKPVLIFDTCIHSGASLAPIKASLKKLGFNKLSVGSINPSDQGAAVRTDFNITSQDPKKGCYPFDKDRMVEKTFDHIYSYPNKNPRKRELGIELREEIKKIVREKMDK